MARAGEVLQMLCPGIEYTAYGDIYEDIVWNSGTPAITKAQYEAGFAQYDAWKAEQDAAQAKINAATQAKLKALGLTVEDLQAIGL